MGPPRLSSPTDALGIPNTLDLAASSLDTMSGIVDAHRTP